jgi:hypothetical protein
MEALELEGDRKFLAKQKRAPNKTYKQTKPPDLQGSEVEATI